MHSKAINGLLHPILATKYITKLILDALFKSSPSLEEFLSNYMMGRKLPHSLKATAAKGFPVRVVYDIGARQGWWSEYLKRHLPATEFILFEANDGHADALRKRGFRFFTGILSDTERDVEWFGKLGTGDSYYKESTFYYDDVKGEMKHATTLDSLVRANQLPQPDLIKLDTQGSEIDILKGGRNALRGATFVYIECSLVAYNKGAPVLPDYISFMAAEGFIPFDICEEHRKGGALIQLDILFVRRDVYLQLDPIAKGLHY